MSTDYGFRCIDCGEQSITDNLRGDAIPQLQAMLANVAVIKPLIAAGLIVSIPWHPGSADALRFAITHLDRAHLVAVADEYGQIVGICNKRWACSMCKAGHICTRDEGHEGECAG